MLGQPVSMLVPQVVGFKLTGALPRRGDGHRPGADRHRDAPPQGGRRQVRRVLRRRPGQPPAGRPGHDRQHGPRIRRDLRDLPDRRRDAPLPRAHGPARAADPAGRGVWQGPGDVPHRRRAPRPSTPTRSSSTSRPSSRAWPARSGRRTASRCSEAKASFAEGAQGDARGPPGTTAEGRPRPTADDRRQERARGSKAKGAAARPSASRTRTPRRPPTGRSARATSTHGSVVIAAITSCTNTSNPSVMVAAGLLAKKAVEQGPDDQALGQGQPGPRLEGRHRLPQGRRARHVPRPAPVQPGRLRLHDLHRQLGPAPGRDLQGDPRRRPRRRRRPQRQPQLRGADQLRRPGQLPGLAPAGRRLRPGRARWTSTSLNEPLGNDRAGQARLPQGHLADPARGPGHDPEVGPSRDVPQGVRRGLRGRRALELAAGARRATSTSGTTRRPTSRTRPTSSDMPDRAAAGRARSRVRGCWRCWATASRPTTSRRPARSRCRARRART